MKLPIKIGTLTLGEGEPRVAAVIGGNHETCLKQAIAAQEAQVEVLELRGDLCQTKIRYADLRLLVEELRSKVSMPILLTFRTVTEGGRYFGDASFSGTERSRLELFKTLIPHVDAVDVELHAWEIRDAVIESAREHKKAVIVSYHDSFTPPLKPGKEHAHSLIGLLNEAVRTTADLVKIAVRARSHEDVDRLFAFTADYADAHKLITISMGRIGTISRLLNPLVGSCLTYGFVDRNAGRAPGQIEAVKLKQFLKQFGGMKLRSSVITEIMSQSLDRGFLTLPIAA